MTTIEDVRRMTEYQILIEAWQSCEAEANVTREATVLYEYLSHLLADGVAYHRSEIVANVASDLIFNNEVGRLLVDLLIRRLIVDVSKSRRWKKYRLADRVDRERILANEVQRSRGDADERYAAALTAIGAYDRIYTANMDYRASCSTPHPRPNGRYSEVMGH